MDFQSKDSGVVFESYHPLAISGVSLMFSAGQQLVLIGGQNGPHSW